MECIAKLVVESVGGSLVVLGPPREVLVDQIGELVGQRQSLGWYVLSDSLADVFGRPVRGETS